MVENNFCAVLPEGAGLDLEGEDESCLQVKCNKDKDKINNRIQNTNTYMTETNIDTENQTNLTCD